MYRRKFGEPDESKIVSRTFRGKTVRGVLVTRDEDEGMFGLDSVQEQSLSMNQQLNDLELREGQAEKMFEEGVARALADDCHEVDKSDNIVIGTSAPSRQDAVLSNLVIFNNKDGKSDGEDGDDDEGNEDSCLRIADSSGAVAEMELLDFDSMAGLMPAAAAKKTTAGQRGAQASNASNKRGPASDLPKPAKTKTARNGGGNASGNGGANGEGTGGMSTSIVPVSWPFPHADKQSDPVGQDTDMDGQIHGAGSEKQPTNARNNTNKDNKNAKKEKPEKTKKRKTPDEQAPGGGDGHGTSQAQVVEEILAISTVCTLEELQQDVAIAKLADADDSQGAGKRSIADMQAADCRFIDNMKAELRQAVLGQFVPGASVPSSEDESIAHFKRHWKTMNERLNKVYAKINSAKRRKATATDGDLQEIFQNFAKLRNTVSMFASIYQDLSVTNSNPEELKRQLDIAAQAGYGVAPSVNFRLAKASCLELLRFGRYAESWYC